VQHLQSSEYLRASCIEGVGNRLEGGTISTVADTNTAAKPLPAPALLKLVSAAPAAPCPHENDRRWPVPPCRISVPWLPARRWRDLRGEREIGRRGGVSGRKVNNWAIFCLNIIWLSDCVKHDSNCHTNQNTRTLRPSQQCPADRRRHCRTSRTLGPRYRCHCHR
jgi:hypothetical protein